MMNRQGFHSFPQIRVCQSICVYCSLYPSAKILVEYFQKFRNFGSTSMESNIYSAGRYCAGCGWRKAIDTLRQLWILWVTIPTCQAGCAHWYHSDMATMLVNDHSLIGVNAWSIRITSIDILETLSKIHVPWLVDSRVVIVFFIYLGITLPCK